MIAGIPGLPLPLNSTDESMTQNPLRFALIRRLPSTCPRRHKPDVGGAHLKRPTTARSLRFHTRIAPSFYARQTL